jgi:THO complex subunit 2
VIQGAGLVEQSALDKRIARVYTKINYEQSKHSLIRENNEGYAKLALLLIGLRDAHDGQAVWKKIVSLIGNFDLDPDRVLDLVVEARMQNSESRHFMQILRHFRKESLVQTIGNMMQSQKIKTPTDPALAEKTLYCGPADAFDGADVQALFNQIPFMPNPRLSEMAAKSIKAGLFSYGDIQPYLEPSDTMLKRISGKRSELTLAKIAKSFTMSMVEIDDNEMIKIFHEENF